MTPTEEIAAAASRLRGLADRATSDVCPEYVVRAVYRVAVQGDVDCEHDDHDTTTMWGRYNDGPFLAAMTPALGRALAAWLATWFGVDFREDAALPEDAQHALAIARLINKGAQA